MWVRGNFPKQKANIELYMKLTRKGTETLSQRDFPAAFQTTLDSFCKQYDKLEKEYFRGVADPGSWADSLENLARALKKDARMA